MTNPDSVISLQDVSKIYRLYQKPVYRVLDLFGLCPPGPAYYTEHAALKNISLTIGRGEKVAFIGRNGAGKSTLLKIITQTVTPTSGTVAVHGSVSALLQIGTGFHGDFSGRQNVYSGLAHQGITGKLAEEKFEEIVEFAELQEYIDQPMKTYSTGMGARLMFSAATSIQPNVLIIDELLGVGDAYFAHKSYERMRQMCTNNGTTLLLVTHDIYSALNMCEHFYWIDRGELKMQGNGKATVNAYEASIKQQEEERLRSRNRAALVKKDEVFTGLRVRFSSRSGFALPEALHLSKIELGYRDGVTLTLPVAEGSPQWTLSSEGNLGPPATVDGIACRSLGVFGLIYHKAEWLVAIPKSTDLKELSADWSYGGGESVDVQVFTDDNRVLLRESLSGSRGWQHSVFPFKPPAPAAEQKEASGHYGTGAMRIQSVEFLNAAEKPVVRIAHGAKLTIRTRFTIPGNLPERAATYVIGFHKAGVAVGGYAYTDRLALPEGESFCIDATLDPLLLGSGQWMVTIGFAQVDYYKQPFNSYFSINDRWYHLIARGFDLQVYSSTSLDASAFLLHPLKLNVWTTLPGAAPARSGEDVRGASHDRISVTAP